MSMEYKNKQIQNKKCIYNVIKGSPEWPENFAKALKDLEGLKSFEFDPKNGFAYIEGVFDQSMIESKLEKIAVVQLTHMETREPMKSSCCVL